MDLKIADGYTVTTYLPVRALILTGEIDLASAQVVYDALDALTESLPEETAEFDARSGDTTLVRIVVDLSAVTFIDLAGISPILRAATDLDQRAARLRLIRWSPTVARLLSRLHSITTLGDPRSLQATGR